MANQRQSAAFGGIPRFPGTINRGTAASAPEFRAVTGVGSGGKGLGKGKSLGRT